MAERTETFTIQDVDADRERRNVADTLGHLDGVLNADVGDGGATVRYDDDLLEADDLRHRVEDMGYATE